MWIYENKELDTMPNDSLGFVYKITNLLNGKQYIGKKLFTAAKRKQVKKKSKKYRIESNWKQYYGSNKELLADVELQGTDNFIREILYLCNTRGQCSYYEAKTQFELGVLENRDKFYNEWISCKIHRKHLKL